MHTFQAFRELRQLLDALCEGTITPEQGRRLEELLLSSPEAEAYYVQYMSLYADLSRHFAGLPQKTEESLRGRRAGVPVESAPAETGSAAADPRTPFLERSAAGLLRGGAFGLAALAAGVLLAVALPWLRSRPDATAPGRTAEPLDNSVAVLLQAPEAVWEDTPLHTRPGSPLPPGWLHLKSGYAHLEFYSGATVILEGPADFQLVSRMEAYCARGKLRATVPPQAHGFTVRSPKLELVDRGTEFGLQVGAGDQTEVHVFQGKVEVYDATAPREPAARELTTGRGLRVEAAGELRPIDSDPATFRTAQDLTVRLQSEMRQRQAAWEKASRALQQDPSLVVYYPFRSGDAWSRTLPDEAGGRQNPHDGAIVGCTWVTGRWAGKQGLEFRRVSDRVRFHVPGTFDALTLVAWVRVDALPNRFNSLMMTEGWEPSAPHWHVSEDGHVELGVQGPNRRGGAHYTTTRPITPERFGQWMQLAVVYDREGHRVTHYVDGDPVDYQELLLDVPLQLGDVELGNWDVGPRHHLYPIRYFSGCMDEFLMFSRALREQEIEQLYVQGRPPL